MKIIKLSQQGKNKDRYFAKVDNEDYIKANKFRWQITPSGYATRRVKGNIIFLHRFIMKANKGEMIDHQNRNRTDCRKSNLRIANYSQNGANRKSRKNSASKYLGVFRKRKLWMAAISKNKRMIYLGSFNSQIKAAKAYDIKANELHGDFANLNFNLTNKH